ncbi:MAG: glycosyltransferase family 4 protein [Bacteroidota bacterium]
MRILQIIQKPQLRGAEIFAAQLSDHFEQKGYEVVMICLFEGNEEIPFKGKIIHLNRPTGRRFTDWVGYKRISDLVNQERPDIVQANAGDTLKYAAISKMLFGWKSKLVFRNANKMSGFLKNPLHKLLNRTFLSQCDYFISVSENCRQDLIEIFPSAFKSSATGTIGTLNFDHIKAADKDTDEEVFINIGSFVPEKNHIFLIEIFEAYRKKYGSGKLWLVGDGKLRDQIEKKIKQNGLTHDVLLFGYRKDALSLLKAADIMIMPSLIEGLPGVILEAQSCQIPVVASAVGGIPEVIFNNVNGFTVEEYNVDWYIDKVRCIITNPVLREQMKLAGSKLINDKYTMDAVSAHFEEIYSSIL